MFRPFSAIVFVKYLPDDGRKSPKNVGGLLCDDCIYFCIEILCSCWNICVKFWGLYKDCVNAPVCVTGWQCEYHILFAEKLNRGLSDWRNMSRAFKTVYIKVWFRKLMESNTWVTKEKIGRLR